MANPRSDTVTMSRTIDYQLAFDLAPIGLVLSRNRTMVDCNRHVCEMFGASREVLMGQSFQILYPSADEYERLGAHIESLRQQAQTKAALEQTENLSAAGLRLAQADRHACGLELVAGGGGHG